MTRKMWLILAAFWLILAACTRMPEEALPAVAEGGVVEGERVTVTFTVPGFSPATKGLGDGGTLNTLHLAVFGGSGYLKEYVEATITGNGSYSYTVDDEEHIVPSYTYSADLVMSDSPRTIHFIGNGPATLPFGYAPAVMSMQLSANGEMGYWQMLYLEHGIRAKRNDDGDFVDKDGNVIPDGGTGYIADETTSAALQGIVLIRNWSKIVLRAESNSNFTPISFAVVNVPARGALAPYSADTGFIENYQSRDFTYLDQTVKYPANLPPGTSFDATIPSAAEFINASGDRVADATQPDAAVYLYERPAPSDRIPPSFVIVYGTYDDPDDEEPAANYFYKVDLMETRQESETEWVSRYYPLFRNFKYQIIIQKIASRGHNTPAAAAASAGSADVSADVTTSHLSDISDGIGRLHVTPWMAKTFTKAHGPNDPVNDLNVILTKRVSNEDVIDTNTGSVTVKTLPPEDGGPDIIQNLSIAAPDEEGWRRISFQTVAPGRAVRTQSIRITGTHETGRLYRDVIISIQPIQPMSVECSNPRMALEKGEPQVIKVNIPDGLVESMFPLDFIIEAEDMTLTPDNSVADNNLPVESGTSISEHSDYAGKPAFYFIKTVTWDEYFSLPRHEDDEEMMWRSFTASFKTNCEYNGTTVWVYNEFFDKASVTFTNFAEKYFKKLGFTVPVPEQTGVDLPLYFELIKDPDGNYPPDYPEILVRIKGLTWKSSDGVSPGPEPGTYIYRHDVASPNVTLSFTSTTSDPDEIEVYLTADEYDPGYVKVYRFPYASMVDGHPMRNNNDGWANNAWSNVAWGHVNNAGGKNVLIGYKDHPDKLNTPVTLQNMTGVSKPSNLTFPITPTGPRNSLGDKNYHEIELSTVGGDGDVEFDLVSPGYVPVHIKDGRFQGNIRTMKVTTSNVIKKGNTYNFTKDTPTFTYSEDSGNCRVTFDRLPEDPYGAITLKAGQTYTMTIESLNSGQNLFYVDMFFDNSGTKVLCPESFQTNYGTIARYYGSNNQYVWNIPQGYSSVTTSITAPADRDVKLTTLYIKAFNGTLYDNGQANNQ